MPKYKVKSRVSHGTTNDKGELTSKEYAVGSEIDLSEDEARSIASALENPPEQFKDMTAEEKAAVESVRNRPDNPDSGVFLPWQTDQVAKQALGIAPSTSLVTGAEPRPDLNKTRMERDDEEKIRAAEKSFQERVARSTAQRESMVAGEGASKAPPGEPAMRPGAQPKK